MFWRKLGNALLYPHIAILIVLTPVVTAALVCAMIFVGSESAIAIITYVLAAYTLTVWCFRVPRLVRGFKRFKEENKYAKRWFDDTHFRVTALLLGSLLWNLAYAAFQLGLGIKHRSFWFYSLAAYYLFLAVMRFILARYTLKNRAGEHVARELVRYRAVGIVLLLMNLAISLMVFFMVYWNRTFHHHEITAIALAAYTFFSFTTAFTGIVNYRKYNSPVYSATRAIKLVCASVSMLTLEETMLTTFGGEEMPQLLRRIALGASGAVICSLILAVSIFMIVRGTKELHRINREESHGTT